MVNSVKSPNADPTSGTGPERPATTAAPDWRHLPPAQARQDSPRWQSSPASLRTPSPQAAPNPAEGSEANPDLPDLFAEASRYLRELHGPSSAPLAGEVSGRPGGSREAQANPPVAGETMPVDDELGDVLGVLADLHGALPGGETRPSSPEVERFFAQLYGQDDGAQPTQAHGPGQDRQRLADMPVVGHADRRLKGKDAQGNWRALPQDVANDVFRAIREGWPHKEIQSMVRDRTGGLLELYLHIIEKKAMKAHSTRPASSPDHRWKARNAQGNLRRLPQEVAERAAEMIAAGKTSTYVADWISKKCGLVVDRRNVKSWQTRMRARGQIPQLQPLADMPAVSHADNRLKGKDAQGIWRALPQDLADDVRRAIRERRPYKEIQSMVRDRTGGLLKLTQRTIERATQKERLKEPDRRWKGRNAQGYMRPLPQEVAEDAIAMAFAGKSGKYIQNWVREKCGLVIHESAIRHWRNQANGETSRQPSQQAGPGEMAIPNWASNAR